MKPWSKTWKAIVETGTRAETENALRLRIILTNTSAVLFSSTLTLLICLFAFAGLYRAVLFSVPFEIALLLPIFLNSRGKHRMASLFLIVGTNILGAILCSFTGRVARTHEAYYVLAGVPWLLIDLRHKGIIIACFLLAVAGYSFVQWGPTEIFVHAIPLTPNTVTIVHAISSLSILSTLTFLTYRLASEYALGEKLLQQQRAQAHQSAKLASLGEMAGGIAHEINTPLAVIMTVSQQIEDLLAEEPVDLKTTREMSGTVVKTAGRIADIVRGLKDFSRDGRSDPMSEVKITDLVESTLSFCHARFRAHGVKLVCEIPDGSLRVMGRGVQLSQVLLNLLNNAFDAVGPRPEKWVEIRAVQTSERSIEIRVSDSGPGIPAEIRENMFQPFFTTKEVGKGTGLGLSVSLGIIQSHRGKLELDPSQPNTCFVIRLPAA